MADKLPSRSKDSIIQGLQECFAVNKTVVKAILDAENWNIEKCLRLLEVMSPKVDKNKNTAKAAKKSGPSQGKENEKKNSGNSNKNNSNSGNNSKSSSNPGNNSKSGSNPGNNSKSTSNLGNKNNSNLVNVNKSTSNPGKSSKGNPVPGNIKKSNTNPCVSTSSGGKKKNKGAALIVKEEFRVQGLESDPWTVVEMGKKPVPGKAKQKTKPSTPALNLQKSSSEPKTEVESKKARKAVLKSAYDIISQKSNPSDRIRDCIKFEIRILILMRGCPGSGKSTYAREILTLNGILNPEEHIFSTDNYFMDVKGNYKYDRNNLDKAHAWNQALVEKMMKIGVSPLIVDNTHVRAWEMMCYAQYAVRLGYVLETLEPPTPWFFNESILAKKNSHGVPQDKISMMLQTYEPNLTGRDLLRKFNVDYNTQLTPPQLVSYPKEAHINALNKAMVGKRPPVQDPSQKEIFKNILKTDSQFSSEKYSDIEIIKKFSLPNAAKNQFQNSKVDKNNAFLFQNCLTKPSSSYSFNKDQLNLPKFGYIHPNVNFPDNQIKTEKSNQTRPKFGYIHPSVNFPAAGGCSDNTLPPYSDLFPGKGVNLIDGPIDDNLGDSLVNPLTPELSKQGTARSSTAPNIVSLDPSEFPSLSSSSSDIHRSGSNGDFAKIRIYEEKTKKLTELFPHLDKEYISDLCADPNKSLDDIVDILLESSINPPDTEQSPEPNQDDNECDGEESSSEEEEDMVGSDMEKDVTMLIQLFPNIKEYKIRDMYEKCAHDLKVALEWLLYDDPSETASEVNDAEDTDSNALSEPVESQDNPSSSDSDSPFNRVLKSLKESNLTDRDSVRDSPNTPPGNRSPQEDDFIEVDEIQGGGNDWNADVANVAEPDESSYNEDEAYASDNDSAGTCDKNNALINETITNKAHSSSEEMASETPITLDRFEAAMENALSSLSKNAVTPSCSESVGQEENIAATQSNQSDLISKFLEWNLSENTHPKSLDKDTDSPKHQRERFGDPNSQIQHSSTNTHYKDFETLKKAQHSGVSSEKVLVGTLDFVSCVEPLDKVHTPKSKLTLDKGISTVDVETEFTTFNNDTGARLASMFPNIPQTQLDSLLTSCVGDLNWAVGLLLDSGHEISPDFNPSEFDIQNVNSESIVDSTGENDELEKSIHEETPSTSEASQFLKTKKRNTQRVPFENINFVMNDESISSHVKKIRNARLGITDSVENPFSEETDSPSTSDFDRNRYGGSSEEDDEEEVTTLDVALSTDFIMAMQAQFGGYIPNVLPDKQVLVSLPVYLARQLHSCIMESLSKQLEEEQKLIDKMIEEDECLARQLQEMENGQEIPESRQSIQEIMDEELALNIHKSINRNKSSSDTIAGKLSRQLLIERFPTMDPIALKNILEDTDHSLDQATQLLEAAGYQKASSPHTVSKMVSGSEEISREEAVEQSGAYREAAKVFFQMRHDCFQKAQKAYSEGNKHVASYYSQMANWHNQRIEQANLLASTMLFNGNKNLTTLDLHFLRVCEAVQVLDLFLDAHISNMADMDERKRQVYIITGRGLHSHDGKSKIRPATITRLKQRSIWYQLVNPGLLMIQLTSKTPLTYQQQK